MRYVYPNNLMARRSEKREVIMGGILLAVFCLLIVGLFIASDHGRHLSTHTPTIICSGPSAEACRLE